MTTLTEKGSQNKVKWGDAEENEFQELMQYIVRQGTCTDDAKHIYRNVMWPAPAS